MKAPLSEFLFNIMRIQMLHLPKQKGPKAGVGFGVEFDVEQKFASELV